MFNKTYDARVLAFPKVYLDKALNVGLDLKLKTEDMKSETKWLTSNGRILFHIVVGIYIWKAKIILEKHL